MNKVRLKALLRARGLDLSDEELDVFAQEAASEEPAEEEPTEEEAELEEPTEEELEEPAEELEEPAEEELEEPTEEELEKVAEELEEPAEEELEEPAEEELEEPAEEELEEPAEELPADELTLALERIAILEAELADYRTRDARQGAEKVLVEAQIKPKFYDIVIAQLAGVDLSTDEGRAALDALTTAFPEFLLEQTDFPEIPKPGDAQTPVSRGRNRSLIKN